jgi:hypothetical protein
MLTGHSVHASSFHIAPSLALTAMGGASITCKVRLWRSGIIWSALSFIVGLGNLACSSIIARHLALNPGEFGYGNTALDFVNFLGLPLQMLSMSVTHYIAHFRSKNDDARLQGLLAGCQKLLFWRPWCCANPWGDSSISREPASWWQC